MKWHYEVIFLISKSELALLTNVQKKMCKLFFPHGRVIWIVVQAALVAWKISEAASRYFQKGSCSESLHKIIRKISYLRVLVQKFAGVQPAYFCHRSFGGSLCSFSEQFIWRTYLRTSVI